MTLYGGLYHIQDIIGFAHTLHQRKVLIMGYSFQLLFCVSGLDLSDASRQRREPFSAMLGKFENARKRGAENGWHTSSLRVCELDHYS